MVLPFAHLGFCSLKHGHALTATKFEVDDPIIVLLEGGGEGKVDNITKTKQTENPNNSKTARKKNPLALYQ